MFYHRVLPPPSNPSKVPVTGLRPPNRDTLLENKIMMNENHKLHTDRRQSHLQHSHRPSISDEQDSRADEEEDSPAGHATRFSARLSRKRESERSSEEDNQPSRQRLPSVPMEEAISKFNESPSQLCLCQPDPKVPRPRNAFILFRQHHQAAVVAQNPGLANPDISKIIGDAWRSSSSEVKNHWKRLADEEKIRHQKQYPDYRYQPRRAGRNSVANSTSTDPDTQRCLKCGGKTMPTPHNLPTPGVTPTPVSPRPSTLHMQQNGGGAFNRGPARYIPSPPPPSSALGPRQYPGAASGPLAFRTTSRGHADSLIQVTPDLKRRRLENPYHPSLSRPRNGAIHPPHSQSIPRPSLPRSDFGMRNPSAPVQRSQPPNHAPAPSTLALAPLRLDETHDSATQAKAVEAMVMSIPAINKIKLLAKISPSLPAPGPASPPHATRGALLAIDGNDEEALRTVVVYLKDYLERENDYKIQVYSKPAPTRCESIAEWIALMRSYHEQSEEIVKYITTIPSASDTTTAVPSTVEAASTDSSPISPKTLRSSKKASFPDNGQKPITSTNDRSEMEGLHTEDSSIEDVDIDMSAPGPPALPSLPYQPTRHPLPIALVPKYQLTLTDAAASTVPIADEYSPTDHWQWMATLWRGVVGPDVTVDVRVVPSGQEALNGQGNGNGGSGGNGGGTGSPSGSGDGGSGSRASEGGGASGSGGSTGANKGMGPVVDVKLQEARAVLLRGEPGGKVSEAGLRRMGFEVGEWLRVVGEKERERACR